MANPANPKLMKTKVTANRVSIDDIIMQIYTLKRVAVLY